MINYVVAEDRGCGAQQIHIVDDKGIAQPLVDSQGVLFGPESRIRNMIYEFVPCVRRVKGLDKQVKAG